VRPGDRTLKVGQELPLQVRAEFAPGDWRDVTWLCRFDSNDSGTAEVDAAGKVRVLRPGETAIRVSFQTQVGVVIVTVPFEQAVKAEAFARRNNFVDEHVFAKLAALRIEPSELCTDAEFLRRAFLDTLGLPPAPWIGTGLSLFYLAFVSACLPTSFLTFGGLLDDPNIRWMVLCLLIIPGCITLLAYVVALIAMRAGRHAIR
jgi:Bacterial Ig-like domain (group 2)